MPTSCGEPEILRDERDSGSFTPLGGVSCQVVEERPGDVSVIDASADVLRRIEASPLGAVRSAAITPTGWVSRGRESGSVWEDAFDEAFQGKAAEHVRHVMQAPRPLAPSPRSGRPHED